MIGSSGFWNGLKGTKRGKRMIHNKEKCLSALEVFEQNFFGILKLNLTTDSYEVIKNRRKYDDYKSMSELLRSFSERGVIHPQDTRAYNDHVDLGYLRDYFAKENAVWRLRFRCKSGNGFSWVMLEASGEELKETLHSLEKCTANYKGKYIDGIVLAIGVVCQNEFPGVSILELEKIADQRMYQDKRLYYQMHGIEKR